MGKRVEVGKTRQPMEKEGKEKCGLLLKEEGDSSVVTRPSRTILTIGNVGEKKEKKKSCVKMKGRIEGRLSS